ncbi:MAG: hypothetical protein IKM85_11185 [Bacteroidales bacterium]|nr:hypothetical protein [Bacteroidales bacterium]
MARGKQTCKILKEIRKQIAADNDINLVIEECTYKGDCLGTCPKCEAEVRYLERELEKRQRMGKAAMIAGVSLGTMLTAASCDTVEPIIHGPLPGEITTTELVDTPIPERIEDTIKEPLMGIVPWFNTEYVFDSDTYNKLLKDHFIFPGMEKMTVVGGKIRYGHIGNGKECNTLEKLVEQAREFSAPSYPGGEQKMLEDIADELKGKPFYGHYNGVMEVAFTVTPEGDAVDVMIEKSLDLNLDAAVIAFFQEKRWEPARYELKDGDASLFECRCVQKILFPLD